MKFFSIDKQEISKAEFISLYGSSYYNDMDRYVPRVSQCSRIVEDEIDRILFRDGIQSKLDVVRILAWKIGKIMHQKSSETGKFEYALDWKNAENYDVTRYKKPFEIGKIAEYIADNIKVLEEKAEHDPQGVLYDLKDLDVKGLGSVYLITLLYFISRNKYPIYDRFAMLAVDAILSGKKPGLEVEYRELPCKDSADFNTIMQNHMFPYIQKMDTIFGDNYQKSRDIDRALWVYGHLFVAPKGSKSC